MNELPKISIVTPSYNQGAYLGETLQSLVDQDYPNLEVIIQEGGSTDDSIEIAQKFVEQRPSTFQLHVEKDSGQADALNRGFRKATGQILGFLNSDDRLRKGCLQRVSKEIDPNRNRHIVFGRSLFFRDNPLRTGQEHACEYTSHFEQLAIWKRHFNQIPQPSTFWTRQVWEQCGEIDSDIHHALDYDLFCRFSQHYRFHKVSEIWSDYRLHANSKTTNKTHEDLMDDCDAISRRYWGSWIQPLRWRCEASYVLYRRSRRPAAIQAVRKAETAILKQRPIDALLLGIIAASKAPLAIGPRLLLPIATTRNWHRLAHLFYRDEGHDLCPNQWIGPYHKFILDRPKDAESLRIALELPERYQSKPTQLTLLINGAVVSSENTSSSGELVIEAPLQSTGTSTVSIAILCNRYFVPALQGENGDDRLLSSRLLSLEFRVANR